MVLIFLITVCAVTLLFTYLVWDNLDGAKDMVPASGGPDASQNQRSGRLNSRAKLCWAPSGRRSLAKHAVRDVAQRLNGRAT